MAFKMKGWSPFHQDYKPKKVVITDAMRKARNDAEIAFNKKLAEEGFSSDTRLEGASKELLLLKKKFDELRQPFIKENMEKLEKAKAEKTGLWSED